MPAPKPRPTTSGRSRSPTGWALPRSIRDALRAWQFDEAARLMTDARTVLAQRGALEAMAARDGVTLPDDMRHLFEAGQLVDASARAEAERNAMLTIAGAAAAQSADSDPLTTIGMLGEHPEANLTRRGPRSRRATSTRRSPPRTTRSAAGTAPGRRAVAGRCSSSR